MSKFDLIKQKTEARLKHVQAMLAHPSYPLLDKVLNKLSSIHAYELLGVSNESLEGVELLHCHIINGIYDDAEYHMKKRIDKYAMDMEKALAERDPDYVIEEKYEYYLDFSAADELVSRSVSEAQMLALVDKLIEIQDYADVHDLDELFTPAADEYFELRFQFKELMETIYTENRFND